MTTTMVRPALKATGLRKSFGEKTALDGIDLNVAEGSIFALLGPNGAGKTTTVQILSHRLDAGRPSLVRRYQPFTPFIETMRGLLLGTAIGYSALLTVAWCALIALIGYRWALKLYNRDPSR